MRAPAPGGTVLVVVSWLDRLLLPHLCDYWRLTPACLQRLLNPFAATLIGSQGSECWPHTVFGIGVKAPMPPDWIESAHRFMGDIPAWQLRDA